MKTSYVVQDCREMKKITHYFLHIDLSNYSSYNLEFADFDKSNDAFTNLTLRAPNTLLRSAP